MHDELDEVENWLIGLLRRLTALILRFPRKAIKFVITVTIGVRG